MTLKDINGQFLQAKSKSEFEGIFGDGKNLIWMPSSDSNKKYTIFDALGYNQFTSNGQNITNKNDATNFKNENTDIYINNNNLPFIFDKKNIVTDGDIYERLISNDDIKHGKKFYLLKIENDF